MASVPDILVTTADSRILLVVGAKFNAGELADIELPLKGYMVQMGVPIGLLVTPKIMGIYRNRYTGISEKSVERIKLVDIPESWPAFSCDPASSSGNSNTSQQVIRHESPHGTAAHHKTCHAECHTSWQGGDVQRPNDSRDRERLSRVGSGRQQAAGDRVQRFGVKTSIASSSHRYELASSAAGGGFRQWSCARCMSSSVR